MGNGLRRIARVINDGGSAFALPPSPLSALKLQNPGYLGPRRPLLPPELRAGAELLPDDRLGDAARLGLAKSGQRCYGWARHSASARRLGGSVRHGGVQPGSVQPGSVRPGWVQLGWVPPGEVRPGWARPVQWSALHGQLRRGERAPHEAPLMALPPCDRAATRESGAARCCWAPLAAAWLHEPALPCWSRPGATPLDAAPAGPALPVPGAVQPVVAKLHCSGRPAGC